MKGKMDPAVKRLLEQTTKERDEARAEVERLRAEIRRVAPFLAAHRFSGYRFVDDKEEKK